MNELKYQNNGEINNAFSIKNKNLAHFLIQMYWKSIENGEDN
jgi:hypothetical protein